jgi:hypothetical protein
MKRTQVTAHAGNAAVVVVVVVVIGEMVKPSIELRVIQHPFNSAALNNSTDTAMLTCALCASPHINSEPQVAVTSIPDP